MPDETEQTLLQKRVCVNTKERPIGKYSEKKRSLRCWYSIINISFCAGEFRGSAAI